MKTLEIEYHNNIAKAYDMLREVFFNQWTKNTLPSLLKKADLLDDKMKQTAFIKQLKSLSDDELDEARWEYNRLFIGPKKPLASTFESVQRSDKNLMMREYTFQVREYYEEVGLEVEKKNHFPDDFIGFEIQYLYYVSLLIVELIKNDEFDNADELTKIKKEFINSHPQKWFPKFCDDIQKESKVQIWKELALFILNVLEQEEAFFKMLQPKK